MSLWPNREERRAAVKRKSWTMPPSSLRSSCTSWGRKKATCSNGASIRSWAWVTVDMHQLLTASNLADLPAVKLPA